MIKKVFVGLTITLILAIGVFGFVSTSYAQEEPETPEAVEVPEQETLEYEYMYQNGAQNADVVPIQTQTRTRLLEEQDGGCDESCDPQQLRQQLGIENAGMNQAGLGAGAGMNQAGLGTGTGVGVGEGVPQQFRNSDGTGVQGAGQQGQNTPVGTGTCDGTGLPQGRGQGGNGN